MKFKADHPSTFIDSAVAAIIRRGAAEAERLRDLHPDQIAVIQQKNWFKMLIPKAYGGLGYSLPEVLKMEEALSWADGSTGWMVTLCSGAAWFAGFLHRSLSEKLLDKEQLWLAGSGAVGGVAEVAEHGYIVNGFWKYATGSLHADVFTANCAVHQNGQPQYHSDGSPIVRAFLFERAEVTLHHHWNTVGMIATASHSFQVSGLRVGEERTFTIDPFQATLRDPVFKYPFLQLAEVTLSINLSGMCMRFLDLADPLVSLKAHRRLAFPPGVLGASELLQNARAAINECRSNLYAVVEESWAICAQGHFVSIPLLREVSLSGHRLAHTSRKLVDDLYPYCGIIAANAGEEINRVWRNIHTASQHEIFNYH